MGNKELCRLLIDNGYDGGGKPPSENQVTVASILMQSGYAVKYNRFLPEGTGVWKRELVVYERD